MSELEEQRDYVLYRLDTTIAALEEWRERNQDPLAAKFDQFRWELERHATMLALASSDEDMNT